MFQFSGRVWVGPGVEDTDVDDAVGVAAAVVAAAVGVGVTGASRAACSRLPEQAQRRERVLI